VYRAVAICVRQNGFAFHEENQRSVCSLGVI
jgi:hypothetical protein